MAITASFHQAQRVKCKASVLIEGLSGRGKSGLALAMAYGLVKDWSKIAAVDTENRSLPLYTGLTLHTGEKVGSFMVGDITPEDGFRPSYYDAYREHALAAGYEALICDSISHMWQYKGGILDMVTEAQRRNSSLNKYTAWGLPEVVTEKNMIMSLIRHPRIHCINTVRVKEKMEFITDDAGKTALRSLGEQQIIMPDLKYEPDLVLTLLNPGNGDGTPPEVVVAKSRYAPFKVDERYKMTASLIEQLRLFLEEGASPEDLAEMQRQEYIAATTAFLEGNPSARAIWEVLKEAQNVKGMPLKDIPLPALKLLFSQLSA